MLVIGFERQNKTIEVIEGRKIISYDIVNNSQ